MHVVIEEINSLKSGSDLDGATLLWFVEKWARNGIDEHLQQVADGILNNPPGYHSHISRVYTMAMMLCKTRLVDEPVHDRDPLTTNI